MPWFSLFWMPSAAIIATIAEVVFAICILIGWKTACFAKWSGVLMLLFALSMSLSGGIKAAFALSIMKERLLEVGWNVVAFMESVHGVVKRLRPVIYKTFRVIKIK